MSALFESLTGLTLRDPAMLWLALLVPAALFVRLRMRRPAILFGPGVFTRPEAGPHGSEQTLPVTWRIRLLPVPRTLWVLGLLLMVVALARPVSRTPLPPKTEGIDILLCVDISSSMAANDMDPERSRLEIALAAAARFISGRPDDRIGLVCFARYPDVRCPLTRDHRALAQILRGVTRVEADGPEDATGIGTAVTRAAQVLGGGEAASKVVILLTDGEENVATADKPEEIAPIHAGQLCETLGVRVYAITAGFGNRTTSGEWLGLDTRQVETLAKRTGGAFYEVRDAGAVAGVYAKIDVLEKAVLSEPRFQVEEAFLPYLILALLLMLVGRVLGSTILSVLP
jgi:Ca-activated chloride channel homolog